MATGVKVALQTFHNFKFTTFAPFQLPREGLFDAP
jgi:hypothetical protein